jgi:TonB family protein
MNWWHYLLLVNIYLVLFYGFYALLLRKETFFQLNRVYLVSALLLSFIIPVIQASWVQNLFITEQVHYTLYGGATIISYNYVPIQNTAITIGQLFTWLYAAGIVLLSARFIWQLMRVRQMINKPEPSAAFSFFKKISLGKDLVKEDAIVAHEQVHARQWHSFDVLLIEAVMIINWFNPVVYFYRFAIKHIHEFIADQQALQTGADKAEYALLLLSQSFNAPVHRLVNPFYNHSLLKKRIMMIQKNKSQRIVLFKYVLSAPLFGLMLILSSATVNNSKAVTVINANAGNLFVKPAMETISGIVDNGEIPTNELQPQSEKSIEKNVSVDTIKNKRDVVYASVETQPAFPGGIEEFYRFLAKTIRYPAEARNANIQGKVFVQFIVEKDGSITNVKTVRGPSHGLDVEAARAVSLSPKWNPGQQHKKPVRVQYTVPVNFALNPDTTSHVKVTNILLTPPPKADNLHAPDAIYESVEIEPTYQGGIEEFYRFLGKTIRYPAEDRQKNVTGKVFVQFVVEKDGSLSNVRALRGPSEAMKEESVRAINLSPKWIPGTQKGQTVRVQYTVPVNFTLAGDANSSAPQSSKINNQRSQFAELEKRMSNRPLIIVDGVVVTNLNSVNIEDVKNMNILKDEPATKLYGAKAANGVIVITTKKKAGTEKPEPPKVSNQ